MSLRKGIGIGLLSFCTAFCVQAQLVISDANTDPFTPENLVTNVFLGSGVEVSNVANDGSLSAVGYFSGGIESIGLERGIVLATSRVKGIAQNNATSEDVGSDDITGGSSSDVDLAQIATGPLEDVFSYTISFVPSADTLRFRYVFASEEYPEFVCDEFNDIFGFFISGPKADGSSYSTENIALVPDPNDDSGLSFTNLPVSIDNIHDGSNGNCPPSFESFYKINPPGTPDFKYDAYTEVFTAEAIVVPCEEYTIKLAIADVGDASYGSCVFLEAKSFGTGTLEVDLNSLSADGSLAEGCGGGELVFSLPETVDQDYVFNIEFFNTPNAATPGIDYPQIPEQLTIPAGSSSISIPLEAYLDGEVEDNEVISFEIQVDVCNRKRFEIVIRDDDLFLPILPNDVTICEGESFLIESELDPDFNLPADPYFENTETLTINPEMEAIYSDISVSGVLPTILSPEAVERVCIIGLEHRDLTDLDIFLVAPGGQFLELSTDNGFKNNNAADIDRFENTCFTPQAIENINNGDNLAGPVFLNNPTYTGEFAPEGVWSDLWDSPNPTNGIWRLLLTDDTNGFEGTLEGWSITFRSFYNIQYEWSSTPSTTLCQNCEDIIVNPTVDTEYTLKLIDSYGCERSQSMNVAVRPGVEVPEISCDQSTESSIQVSWTEVSGSLGYEIRLNGQNWINLNNDLNYEFQSLASGTDFTIELRALSSDCSSEIIEIQCATDQCPKPALSFQIDQEVSCPQGNDGRISIIPVGEGPFTFELNGEVNSSGVFENLPIGEGSILVTDALACGATLDFFMPGPDDFEMTPNFELSDPCNVVTNITGSFEVTGGSPPYSYQWSNLTSSPQATNLSVGTYFLTITDDNSCTSVGVLEIPDLDQFVYSVSTIAPICQGENNGVASIVEFSGNGPYTYLWEDGTTEQSNPNLSAGFYVVTVTDALGCSSPTTFTIEEGPSLNLEITISDISCPGQEDASASISIIGGSEPYTINWNGGVSTENTLEGLGPGNYGVTVSDVNNCIVSQNFLVNEAMGIQFVSKKVDNDCFMGNEGTIEISQQSSPNGNVSISWEDGNSDFTRVNLPNGNYCFTLNDDSGCQISDCIAIVSPDSIEVFADIQGPTCVDSQDGSISIDVSGGIAPYTFQWTSPDGDIVGGPTISDLEAGAYSLTVTDDRMCSSRISFEVMPALPISVDQTVIPISCKGESTGQILFSAIGGLPPFTYSWNGPDGFQASTNNIMEVGAGSYTVTYNDANGCGGIQEFFIQEPSDALLSNIAEPDTICFGSSNGKLSVQPSGGSGPYSIIWSNGELGESIFGLEEGEYSVSITDSRGCQSTSTSSVFENGEINIQISQTPSSCFQTNDGGAIIEGIFYGLEEANPADFDISWNTPTMQTGLAVNNLVGGSTYIAVVVDQFSCKSEQSIIIESPDQVSAELIDLVNVSCFGEEDGSLQIRGSGGNGNYSYQWDIGANLDTSSLIENLGKGSYSVTITDQNSCNGFNQFAIEEPRPLSMDFRVIDVSCFGGSDGRAEAIVEGGVGPYTFEWTNNASGMAIENTISEQYNVTVTDANGCTLVDSTKIEEPEEGIMISVDVENITCFEGSDGRINIDASGGSGFYRYSIDGVEFTSGSQFAQLGPGAYDVYVSDFKGCTDTFPDILITEPPEVIVDFGDDLIIPFGEEVQLIPRIEQTSGPLSFEWISSSLDLLSCTNCLTPIFTGERASTYELIVFDGRGCGSSDIISIRLENYSPLFVPTAFTPNGDDENDVLQLFGARIAEVSSFQIYNRWGELVFSVKDSEIDDEELYWKGVFKGEESPSGLYYWFAEVIFENGFVDSFKGNTTLLR